MQEKGREREGVGERERQTDRQKLNAEEIYSTQNILYYYWFTVLHLQFKSVLKKKKIIISVMLNGLSRRYVKNLRYSKVVFNIYFKPLTYLNLLPQSNIKKYILFPLTFKF